MSECPTVNGGDRRDRWDGSRILALVERRIGAGFEEESEARVRVRQGQILDVGRADERTEGARRQG